jgi:regulator of protease activity HflC (stomatin/prohibitin superfamily)
MLREKEIKGVSGWAMLLGLAVLLIFTIIMFISEVNTADPLRIIFWLVAAILLGGCLFGLTIVNPNEARVVQLFGRYCGTLKVQGLRWVNPLTLRRKVSLRVRNFESGKLKVNDHDGNPIDIAAVVVWRVVETAEAVFHVDDYEHFVHVQSESALRNLATSYPYDAHVEGQLSLRMSSGEISHKLREEIQERLAQAGVEVIEARISHLAYASEIASAMLRRQQASAIIAARQKIVEGAVGMVEMALDLLSTKNVVQLDEERKATMVSNLLVVLCGEREAQPIVNAGTLYQ